MDGLFYEMRNTWRDISGAKADWRTIGRRALPVVVTAAAGTVALCAKKQFSPPDGQLLTKRVQFECAPAKQGYLSPDGALDAFLQDSGADASALRRAARRLRGPIERDLLTVERKVLGEGADRRSLYSELLEKWRASGYLSEPVTCKAPRAANLGLDLVTQEDESYGRDVGCEVPLCLLQGPDDPPADLQSLSVQDTMKAAEALSKYGVAMCRSVLSFHHVEALRERLQVRISALDKARASTRGGFAPVREYDVGLLQMDDPELEPVISTVGRRHLYLRGRALEEAVKDAQAGLMPLVWEYAMQAGEACGIPPSQNLYISEVQLLVTDPCAVDQFWHIDNTAPGITVLIPLTPVSEEIGPTHFIPSSHLLFGEVPGAGRGSFRRFSEFMSSILSMDREAVSPMNAGDALIYDSRLLHYGGANRLYDRTRIALVFRYDFERPPGVGVVGTQLLSWLGNVLSQFLRFYAFLPGPSAESA